MILSKEQINKYSRHIIMPEISGPGQRILLESTVLVQSQSAETAAPLLYYLAAEGIGRLICRFEDDQGREGLFNNLRDLSSDLSIVCETGDQGDLKLEGKGCRIIFGSAAYATEKLGRELDSGIPLIAAINRDWEGYIQVLNQPEQMDDIRIELKKSINAPANQDRLGTVFSTCLLGALAAIEVTKLMLDIGTSAYNPLSFDLLTMSFQNQSTTAPASSQFFRSPMGYDRNNISPDPEGGKKGSCNSLSDRRVLVVGTGGLGSPAAYALTRAGIGTIGLVDYDTVDISNLNRQILHSTSRLGLPKVDSAAIFLHLLNPDVTVVKHNVAFDTDNAIELISGYDVIIDGVDNFSARYMLNDTCYLTQKPMMEAGVAAYNGMGMTIIPGQSMCYRCLFPHIPAPGTIPSCSETGVLGPVPGVMGFIEACEAAKLLTGQGRLLTDTLLTFDALDLGFEAFQNGKNPACPLCGTDPVIKELQNYNVKSEN